MFDGTEFASVGSNARIASSTGLIDDGTVKPSARGSIWSLLLHIAAMAVASFRLR